MKKYVVFDEEYITIEEAVEAVLDAIDEDSFEDYLHDEFGWYVDICGEEFDPVEVLRDMDSGLYDDKYEDWKREIEEEVKDTIESMDIYDTETLYGVDIECIDDEEEDEEEEPAPAPVLPASAEDKAQAAVVEAMEAYQHLCAMLEEVPKLYLNKSVADEKLRVLKNTIDTLHDFVFHNYGDSES